MSVRMSSMHKSPISAIIDILQRMPIRRRSSHPHSPNEYLSLWTQWHEDVEALNHSFANAIEPNLQEILAILAGRSDALERHCSGFMQSVVSRILFHEHISATQSIRQLFHECYNTLSNRTIIDKILVSFATSDLDIALKKTSKHFPSWLVVHLTDLLFHHPYILKKHYLEASPLKDIRSHLIAEYAQFLSADSSLIEVTCSYLSFTNDGHRFIDAIIERQPITSEKHATKLLRLYSSLLDDLQSVLESKALDVTKYKDLDFLVKYKELISLWRGRNFDVYAKTFCEMLRDKVIPKMFWMRLLLDTLPLLESSKRVYFNTEESLLLLNCLEEISTPHLADQYLQDVSDNDVQTLRLALARNISKAIMNTKPTTTLSSTNQQQQQLQLMMSPNRGIRSAIFTSPTK
eukprot:gene7412-8668_t